ncbi:hypothetical protein K437DRAFT_118883 [Tilletiaria anomala UBC 951]|uniref:Uncharacterized protein n=1 Tax=Tilletiaria anomala (strain ATCC 24038 / CBS 436.72 / UBC 951) TaxID=1037660 RepID=A0A066W4P6_TILAU|nr:uncharacterized protein K437DRAFT_118883 [Tilletiaria anomala UBC 951]KDN45745.1 hypothetical protein K437DRAFT_118883 [Tilletiaria anomala UBC 951]
MRGHVLVPSSALLGARNGLPTRKSLFCGCLPTTPQHTGWRDQRLTASIASQEKHLVPSWLGRVGTRACWRLTRLPSSSSLVMLPPISARVSTFASTLCRKVLRLAGVTSSLSTADYAQADEQPGRTIQTFKPTCAASLRQRRFFILFGGLLSSAARAR